jgi:hypothetical protein
MEWMLRNHPDLVLLYTSSFNVTIRLLQVTKPDATQDVRFKESPLVTGLGVPFMPVPLISPEGPKLGTLCLIDVKPRPEGLFNGAETID